MRVYAAIAAYVLAPTVAGIILDILGLIDALWRHFRRLLYIAGVTDDF